MTKVTKKTKVSNFDGTTITVHYSRILGTENVAIAKSYKMSRIDTSADYIIITRRGLINYCGEALCAYYGGKKGIDYISFNSEKLAEKKLRGIIKTNKL